MENKKFSIIVALEPGRDCKVLNSLKEIVNYLYENI